MRLNLGPTGSISAIWLLLALLILSLALFWATAAAYRANDSADQREALNNHLLASTADVEMGQRGFLLTGREEYLEAYESARRALLASRARLVALSTTETAPRISSILDNSDRRLSELSQTILRLRNGDETGAIEMVFTGDGKRTMDRIREEVAAIKAQQARIAQLESGETS